MSLMSEVQSLDAPPRKTVGGVAVGEAAAVGAAVPTPHQIDWHFLLPNNQRQHRTLHAPKDLLP